MYRFKELKIWKRRRLLCSKIYELTAMFPQSEKFGLTNQLRRTLKPIPSNIAEGSSRYSNTDFSRFSQLTLSSVYDIETQLLNANDLKFITKNELETITLELKQIIKMVSKFNSTLV